MIAECQKAGGTAAFIDAEHALDPLYAKKLGVNVDELLLSQPDTGEQALEVADMLVKSNSVDLLVVDSVAALTPRAEIEGEMEIIMLDFKPDLCHKLYGKLLETFKDQMPL